VLEYLTSKYEALTSNPSIAQNKQTNCPQNNYKLYAVGRNSSKYCKAFNYITESLDSVGTLLILLPRVNFNMRCLNSVYIVESMFKLGWTT
jgi:hypothetical protein